MNPERDKAPGSAPTKDKSPATEPEASIASVERRVERRLRAEISRSFFSGPLPPPDVLREYNGVFPGCAERIVALAERQSSHRQGLESAVVKGNIDSERRGQDRAFWLSVLVIAIGGLLIWNDKDISGLVLIIGNLIVLAGIFVYGRYQARQEREAQRKEQAPPNSQLQLPFEGE